MKQTPKRSFDSSFQDFFITLTDAVFHIGSQDMSRRAVAHERTGSIFATTEGAVFEIVSTFINIFKKEMF